METSSKSDKKSSLAKWLKKLQRESWELEVLISGMSIYLLFQLPDQIDEVIDYVSINVGNNNIAVCVAFMLLTFKVSTYVLIFNLVTHIILRGFWIGVIGLHSVFPDGVKFEKLAYSEYFNKKLKQKIPPLDDWTVYLDNICSIIFGFTYLIILSLVSLGLYFVFLIVYIASLDWILDLAGVNSLNVIVYFLLISLLLLILLGIVYLIDFFTLGVFKKMGKISKFYYFFYKILGYITLAFLYRPIYYTFISNISKRKIGLFLMFYVLCIFIAITVSYDSHIYFPDKLQKNILTTDFYDNLRLPGKDYIDKLSINADIIKEGYLKLFIYYNLNDNNLIGKLCPEYKPDKKEGITSVFNDFEYSTSASSLQISSKSIDPKANKLALKCLSSLYSIYINDSLYEDAEFFFYKHPNKGEKGIITYLPTEGLPKGRNTLEVKKKKFNYDNKITEEDYAYIPFWVE